MGAECLSSEWMEIGNQQALPGGVLDSSGGIIGLKRPARTSHCPKRAKLRRKRKHSGSTAPQKIGVVWCQSGVAVTSIVMSVNQQSRIDLCQPVRRWRCLSDRLVRGNRPNGDTSPVHHARPGAAGQGSPRGRSAPHQAAMPVVAAATSDRMMPGTPLALNAAAMPCAAWYPAMAAGDANAKPTKPRNSGDRAWPISNWPMASAVVAAASPAISEISRPAPIAWTHSAAAPPHQSGRAWTASDHSNAPARQAQTRIRIRIAAINMSGLSRRVLRPTHPAPRPRCFPEAPDAAQGTSLRRQMAERQATVARRLPLPAHAARRSSSDAAASALSASSVSQPCAAAACGAAGSGSPGSSISASQRARVAAATVATPPRSV